MADFKPQLTSEFQEFDMYDENEKSARKARSVESVRLGLTLLALMSSIVIMATAGDALSNYNKTALGSEYIVSLWPNEFDIRPTTTLVVCSAIVFIASTLSIVASKISAVRNNNLIHSAISFVAPTVCLIAGLIGTSFFYGVNASNTQYSLQSWSCQWSPIKMDTKPHWGTLCKESKTALYLTVMLIPLEVIVLSVAVVGGFAQKKHVAVRERKGSPAMS